MRCYNNVYLAAKKELYEGEKKSNSASMPSRFPGY